MNAVEENHKAHQMILLSTSVLFNPFCPKNPSLSRDSFINLIGKDVIMDVLAIEQAVLLYNICWLALESYGFKSTRYIFLSIQHFLATHPFSVVSFITSTVTFHLI